MLPRTIRSTSTLGRIDNLFDEHYQDPTESLRPGLGGLIGFRLTNSLKLPSSNAAYAELCNLVIRRIKARGLNNDIKMPGRRDYADDQPTDGDETADRSQ